MRCVVIKGSSHRIIRNGCESVSFGLAGVLCQLCVLACGSAEFACLVAAAVLSCVWWLLEHHYCRLLQASACKFSCFIVRQLTLLLYAKERQWYNDTLQCLKSIAVRTRSVERG